MLHVYIKQCMLSQTRGTVDKDRSNSRLITMKLDKAGLGFAPCSPIPRLTLSNTVDRQFHPSNIDDPRLQQGPLFVKSSGPSTEQPLRRSPTCSTGQSTLERSKCGLRAWPPDSRGRLEFEGRASPTSAFLVCPGFDATATSLQRGVRSLAIDSVFDGSRGVASTWEHPCSPQVQRISVGTRACGLLGLGSRVW